MSVQSNIESGATEKVWELQQPQRSGGAVWEEGRVRIRDHDKQNFGVMFLTEYTDEAGPNDWEMGYFAVDDVSYSHSAACDLLPTTALPRGGRWLVSSPLWKHLLHMQFNVNSSIRAVLRFLRRLLRVDRIRQCRKFQVQEDDAEAVLGGWRSGSEHGR